MENLFPHLHLAKWYGKEIIKIDRWYPSSQICSVCGENIGKKALSIREWTCPFCNTTHDTRHTFASMMNKVGANDVALTTMIGHTDINLTKSVYTHKELEDLEETIKLGCIINGVDGRNFYQCHFLIKKS